MRQYNKQRRHVPLPKKKKKKKKKKNKERIGHDSRFLEIEVKSFILCVKLFYIKVKIY